jgi:uncharacterized protein (DUF362 family)
LLSRPRIRPPKNMTSKSLVSIVRYAKPQESVRKAIELCRGLDHLPRRARVFIKPNIVFWTRETNFPKYGVITTSRVVEDAVVLLKEYGVDDILIGEGTVLSNPAAVADQEHAFETLGYGTLKKRYGVRPVNIWKRPFKKIDLGGGVWLNFNSDILESDFVVDLPVLKTHSMTVVSLGIKNLKGMIDIPSRKKCHNTDPQKDLHFMVARLADRMPPIFCLLDGIYTSERGPNIDGTMHRSNLLVASSDVLSADMVGARILGHSPEKVPHLVHAAHNRHRPVDLSDIEVVGESIERVASPHQYDFVYTGDNALPLAISEMGVKGLAYYKYDLSLCTYCSGLTRTIFYAIARAWKGEAWNDVEVLSGKIMQPRPGKRKTILFGKCMVAKHKDNSDIREIIAIRGCPPKPDSIFKALRQAGIDVDPKIFENIRKLPGNFLKRYEGRPEFNEAHFKIG